MTKVRHLAILLLDDAEVLDFCGPYEVFSVASNQSKSPSFNVMTIAEQTPVTARNGLSVNRDHSLESCPKPDVLLVPGGIGTRRELNNGSLIESVRQVASDAELVLSVCTDALLLGKAGLLDGLEATTHHVAYDLLREIVPSCTVHKDRRFIDNGKIITSAGIAAGIDMSLHVVERLLSSDIATATARHMEYPWKTS
jgi:transcriptional regulator GlxA family with amidase domain